jgi:chromosome segregation ATPase
MADSDSDTFDSTADQYNVHHDMSVTEKSILLQRSQSRNKQLEFDLAVSQEVGAFLTKGLQDSTGQVKSLGGQLDGTGKLQLGQAGLNRLLSISQAKLKKQEANAGFQNEQVQGLSSELKQSRRRLRELELERSIHLSKLDDCLQMLEAQSSPKEHEMQHEALRVTELTKRLECLKQRMDNKDKTIKKLKEEATQNKTTIKKLTKLLEPSMEANEINETIDCLKSGDELSPEQAQRLTTQHLRSRVESLFEEKSMLMDHIADLSKQLEEASLANSTSSTRKNRMMGNLDMSSLRQGVAKSMSNFRKKP